MVFNDLLYFCDVQWLSRGAMLNRVYQLRKEIAREWTEFYECETKFTADKVIHRNIRTNGMKREIPLL